MHAATITARAPQHRFPRANDTGFPIVPTRFQPDGPCSPGGDCCPECSGASASQYLARDIEARPRIPSAFRSGMQGLSSSSNAYLAPFVKGDWGPAYAARRLPGTAPEQSRPEGFHGLGAANVAIRAADARIVAASNLLARTPFGNAELNASGLHRYQVVSSAAAVLQTLSFGAFDRSMLNDYRDSICRVDDAGNVLPGSGGDVARGRAIITAILGGTAAIAGELGGEVGNAAAQALTLIKNEVGELENEMRQRCENVAAARSGGTIDLAHAYFARHPVQFPLTPKGETATGMSTGMKYGLAALGLGVFGALVYAVAK